MQKLSRRFVLTGSVTASVVAGLSKAWAGSTNTEHIISIRKFKFKPRDIQVRIGDTIKWENHDLAPHTATGEADTWDTGPLKKGQSKTLKVTAQMAGKYYCAFHPQMKGQITVET